MSRPLTASEAAAALARGREVEQVVALEQGFLTYLTASASERGFVLRRHLVVDEGREDVRDISEFSPVDEEQDVGEGVVVHESAVAAEVVQAADHHGGTAAGWVNQGMAGDDYWRARQRSS